MSDEKKIVSAPPVAPLTPEQKKARYAELRKKFGRAKSFVGGKSGIHYFWAAKDDGSEMARLDMIGYSIVREPNAKEVLSGTKKPEIDAAGLREDGTYCLGDTILMCCPQDVYEFSLLDVEERFEVMKRSAKENFLTEAEKAGAPTFQFSK